MPVYEFILTAPQGMTAAAASPIPTAPSSIVSSGVTATTDAPSSAFLDGASSRLQNQAEQIALAPLNSMTGGLANPAYSLGKAIVTGAGAGAIASGVVMLAFAVGRVAVKAIQKKTKENESKAEQQSNNDNALIRGGSVTTASYYKGSLFGVRKTNRG